MPGAEPLDHKGEDPEGARLRDEGEGFARLLIPYIILQYFTYITYALLLVNLYFGTETHTYCLRALGPMNDPCLTPSIRLKTFCLCTLTLCVHF